MVPNTHHELFSIHHFVRTYLHNMKTKGRIKTLPNNWLLYYEKYLFSALELFVRYDRWVMESNTHRNLFQYNIYTVYILTLVTWKIQVLYKRCTYWMTALLSGVPIFCVRAGCEIGLVSYGSKHSLQFLSDQWFVHPYTHNLKTTGYIWTFSVSYD